MRSIYHIREYNIRRLSLLSSPMIFLSHDWPQSIEHHGDLRGLLRRKPFFRADIEKGELGSPPMMGLLHQLKPQWWFSAHLHVRFEATVQHEEILEEEPAQSGNPDEIVIADDDDADEPKTEEQRRPAPAPSMNPDEITLDDEEFDVSAPPPPPPKPVRHRTTQFLALDKCLPRRQFLEIVDVPAPTESDAPTLAFDVEWLAITRAFAPYMSTSARQPAFPDEPAARAAVQSSLDWVRAQILAGEPDGVRRVADVQQFGETAPAPGAPDAQGRSQPPYYRNPQTAAFCSMLEIENKVDPR